MLVMLDGEINHGGVPVPLYAVPSMLKVSYPMGTGMAVGPGLEFHVFEMKSTISHPGGDWHIRGGTFAGAVGYCCALAADSGTMIVMVLDLIVTLLSGSPGKPSRSTVNSYVPGLIVS